MNYANIIHGDMLNGIDYGIAFFPSGCTLKCDNCQNKHIWSKDAGVLFDNNAKQEIFEALNKDYNHRFSFVGGHVFEEFNLQECTQLAKEIRKKYPDKTIWCYTGYKWEDICNCEIITYIDVIVDGRFIEKLKDNKLHWRGSSNQRVIDVKKTLENKKVVLYDE